MPEPIYGPVESAQEKRLRKNVLKKKAAETPPPAPVPKPVYDLSFKDKAKPSNGLLEGAGNFIGGVADAVGKTPLGFIPGAPTVGQTLGALDTGYSAAGEAGLRVLEKRDPFASPKTTYGPAYTGPRPEQKEPDPLERVQGMAESFRKRPGTEQAFVDLAFMAPGGEIAQGARAGAQAAARGAKATTKAVKEAAPSRIAALKSERGAIGPGAVGEAAAKEPWQMTRAARPADTSRLTANDIQKLIDDKVDELMAGDGSEASWLRAENSPEVMALYQRRFAVEEADIKRLISNIKAGLPKDIDEATATYILNEVFSLKDDILGTSRAADAGMKALKPEAKAEVIRRSVFFLAERKGYDLDVVVSPVSPFTPDGQVSLINGFKKQAEDIYKAVINGFIETKPGTEASGMTPQALPVIPAKPKVVIGTKEGPAIDRNAPRLASSIPPPQPQAAPVQTPPAASTRGSTNPRLASIMQSKQIPPPVAQAAQGANAAPPPPPPVKPPAPPAGAVPPAATPPVAPTTPPPGNRYVVDMRPMPDVQAEVVTSDNPVVRAFVGHTGINPSVLQTTDVGKATVAYQRQLVAGEQLAEQAVAAALDAQARRFTGLANRLPINGEGFFGKTGKLWQDVFSKPNAYKLTPEERAYIDEFNTLMTETEAMRVAAGLPARSMRLPTGEFYVPRDTKVIRAVELRKLTNHNLRRIYDEATDGFANGIRYQSDPRATAHLYVQSAYREVAEKQLSDAVEAFGVPPSKLVPAPIRTAMENAIKTRQATERKGRADILAARKALARPANTPGQIAARKRDLARLNATVTRVAADNAAAKVSYMTAKSKYSKAMEAARKAEVGPGTLFNTPEPDIPIRMWRNNFFPKEMADALNKVTGPRASGGIFEKGLEKTGNTIRFLASTLDFAAPFIQGLPVLARNPQQWARATALHYGAFFDPTVGARYIKNHLDTVQKMAKYAVPVGDTEAYRALQPGGGFTPGKALSKLPKGEAVLRGANAVGRQTYGRFQASYNTFLTVARTEMWEAQAARYAGKEADLGKLIRNKTGGADSRALGVGAGQRAAESIWLAFSPRLLRSTVGLVADARNLNTMAGRDAAMTLGKLVGGATAFYIATGIALGKSEEEIKRGLNPLGGKYFLSHEINGEYYGVGGQVRAITQLMAAIVTQPQNLVTTWDRFDNPLINFYFGRGAPAVNVLSAVAEEVTGQNIDPYNRIQSPLDVFTVIGTSGLPMNLQAILEGQSEAGTAASMAGFRVSQPNTKDRFEQAGYSPEEAERIINSVQAQKGQLTARENALNKAGTMTPEEAERIKAARERLDAYLLSPPQRNGRAPTTTPPPSQRIPQGAQQGAGKYDLFFKEKAVAR